MNDRIMELVRESHLDVYALGKDRSKWEDTVKKFTELIVKECALTAGLLEQEGRKGIVAQVLDNYVITLNNYCRFA